MGSTAGLDAVRKIKMFPSLPHREQNLGPTVCRPVSVLIELLQLFM